ncbi:hypothetical protein Agub_g11025, partial [Astrephomene gubernaculifera]
MAFLQRLASGIKEGLVSFTEPQSRRSSEFLGRGLQKQSSRGNRPTSVSIDLLESHVKDAIATFVREKFDKGEAKPHVFTQFWLQFPKLEAGFEVLRRQLESRTGSREGPLPLELLRSNSRDFGLDESSAVVQELCSKALSHKCREIDFVGLVMLLLVVHLTEPPAALAHLHPGVRTMLGCLELAFTHFNSARRGKLDKREVAEALQYESAKAHAREGRGGRTSNRLAHRLFEGLDWEYDNTISFENFLRGILQLVQDEFGEEEEEEGEAGRAGQGEAGDRLGAEGASWHGTASEPRAPRFSTCSDGSALGASAAGRGGAGGAAGGGERRARANSATGMTGAAAAAAASAPVTGSGGGGGGGSSSSSAFSRSSSLVAGLRNVLRKSDVG